MIKLKRKGTVPIKINSGQKTGIHDLRTFKAQEHVKPKILTFSTV